MHCHSEYNATMWPNHPAAVTHSDTCRGRGDGTTCLMLQSPLSHVHLSSHKAQGKTPSPRAGPGWGCTSPHMIRAIRKSLCPKGCFGYTRVGSISPMQDLTVWPPSCVISENSRSLAAIFLATETPDIALEYTSPEILRPLSMSFNELFSRDH